MINDLIRGSIELPANDNDMILMKSSGLPTYHLAHPVDDSLMQVSVAIRSRNLLTLTPLHIDVFEAIGRPPPVYAHLPFLSKMDEASRHMISRSRDPEMTISHFRERGYPLESLTEYLLSLANPGFGEWREKNPESPYADFPLELSGIPSTDIVFALSKYHTMVRKHIAALDPGHAYSQLLAWAQEFQPSIRVLLEHDTSYTERILRLASRCGDIAKWEDFSERYGFFWDEIYDSLTPEGYGYMPELPQQDILCMLSYLVETASLVSIGSKEAWLGRMHMYAANNFTVSGSSPTEMAARKEQLHNILTVLCVALTAKQHSPNFYTIVKILGTDRIIHRLQMTLDHLNGNAQIT